MKIFQSKSKLAAVAAAPVLALAVALISGAFTQHASAQTPINSNKPFAVGAFTAMDLSHVAFAAQIVPTKTGYAGYVVQELSTGQSRSGPVTCVWVAFQTATSSSAAIVWKVKNTNISGDMVGEMRSFEVIDNGPPTPGGFSPDMYKNRDLDNTCGPDGSGSWQGLLRGNIVVTD
jgi:hypothetical protein